MTGHRNPCLPALVALLLAGPVPAQQPAPQEPPVPVFEAGIEAVSLDVYVSRDGQAVTGLTGRDFEVRDAGVEQPVQVVAREEAPLDALLVLDVSVSVAGVRLAELTEAAAAFLDGLGAADRAGLLVFNHRARLVVPPGSPVAVVRTALGGARAEGGTALHDAVFAGLGLLDPRRGRPVVVVFSDGADRVSWLSADKVVDAARQSEAVLYAVDAAPAAHGIDVPLASAPTAMDVGNTSAKLQGRGSVNLGPGRPHSSVPGATFLSRLAEETGGQAWPVVGGGDLRTAFLSVLAEVQSRYVLRYEPRGGPRQGWHPVEVRLRSPGGAQLRVKKGYFAGN